MWVILLIWESFCFIFKENVNKIDCKHGHLFNRGVFLYIMVVYTIFIQKR